GDTLDVIDFVGCQTGGGLDQPAGELALQCDDRETVAEQIVQVTGKAQPLLSDRKPSNLLAGQRQLLVRFDQQPAGDDRQTDQQVIDEIPERVQQGGPANDVHGPC